jgi:acid phosphatase family membrane protein YuiD
MVMNLRLTDLFENHVIVVTMVSWLLAQSIKLIIDKIRFREVDFTRIVGAGGMPSSHSAFVTSLATSIAFQNGLNSTEFALAFSFAAVVMYDAAGVRRSAGKQAVVLNKIVHDLYSKEHTIKKERLKELIGHSPVEVFAGAVLGILVAIFMA